MISRLPVPRFAALAEDAEGSEGDLDELFLANIDPLEAARRRGDSLGSMDIAAHVAELFRAVAAANPDLMRAAAAELTPTQTQAVQRIWEP